MHPTCSERSYNEGKAKRGEGSLGRQSRRSRFRGWAMDMNTWELIAAVNLYCQWVISASRCHYPTGFLEHMGLD